MGQFLVPPVTQLLGSKWLKYFSRRTERKIESFWPKKLGQILVPTVTWLLGSKWLNILSRCTERKNWVIWPKKMCRILISWVVTKTFKLKKTFIVLVTQWVTGSLVSLLKLAVNKQNTSKLLLYKLYLKWFWK